MCVESLFCGVVICVLSNLASILLRQANSAESDHECTSRIFFDNAGENVTLTLYNVTLASQKPYLHNNKCDCSKTNGLNEVSGGFFFNKIAIFY